MATSTFLDSVTPWSSRAATPRPDKDVQDKKAPASTSQQGTDHRVNPRHRLNPREYPHDAPELRIRWFFSETPKRKPAALTKPGEWAKPAGPSKKFASFSSQDSRSIEAAFQRLAVEEERRGEQPKPPSDNGEAPSSSHGRSAEDDADPNPAVAADSSPNRDDPVLVPVNEDFLFDVNIDARELAPAYWLGPIYEVRRGTWFYHDGSPCDENLAIQLEEGYVKTKPWRTQSQESSLRSVSESRTRPTSWKAHEGSDASRALEPDSLDTPSTDGIIRAKRRDSSSGASLQPKAQLQTHRLFGSHMNSIVTYQDATTAWLLTDDFYSRMSSSVYQRIAGEGHRGGTKVVRGFTEPAAAKKTRPDAVSSTHANDTENRGRSPAPNQHSPVTADQQPEIDPMAESERSLGTDSVVRRQELERRMEDIVKSPGLADPAAEEEEVRKREEAEIQEDYRDQSGDEQRRTIDHLVFVTHGIGQRLGLRMESLNFIHDVNVLRKTLKSVYDNSPDLQALNFEVDQLPKNCRIQVLPIVWRHLLDFPRPASGSQRREQDLSDANAAMDDLGYPSLNDITIDGVPAIRNLVEDLFLDILLYQSTYRDHIADIIRRECNRVFKSFRTRNPQFNGKVSFLGHSLGSAIMFDLLCWQKSPETGQGTAHNIPPSRRASYQRGRDVSKDCALEFPVENFYCLGSPIGLFQMIKGRTISGRPAPEAGNGREPWELINAGLVSSPKCQQLFNIFHPTDPVAYRIEPLVSPAMKNVKPQPLPYVKRGIFGAPGMGITGLGARVGQSVSGLWSNITSGVANSLLNRSLGLTEPQSAPGQHRKQLSMAGAMEATGERDAGGSRASLKAGQDAHTPMAAKAEESAEQSKEPTDPTPETLYAGFKRHQSGRPESQVTGTDKSEWRKAESRARQLRIVESKVKGLNRNGRIDYSIQEGVFDISLIASLASHLSYWADEDVSHFVMSQLLSPHKDEQKRATPTPSEGC